MLFTIISQNSKGVIFLHISKKKYDLVIIVCPSTISHNNFKPLYITVILCTECARKIQTTLLSCENHLVKLK